MPVPGQSNVSQTARLMVAPPGFAIGWTVPLYLPDPAAGAGWSHKTPGGYFERLLTVRFQYAASAAVANRYPRFRLRDANNAIVISVPTIAQVVAGNNLTVNLTAYGQPQSMANGAEAFNVLIRTPEGPVSLVVDRVGDVVEVSPDTFEPAPDTLRSSLRPLIRGAYNLERRLLLALDAEAAVQVEY